MPSPVGAADAVLGPFRPSPPPVPAGGDRLLASVAAVASAVTARPFRGPRAELHLAACRAALTGSADPGDHRTLAELTDRLADTLAVHPATLSVRDVLAIAAAWGCREPGGPGPGTARWRREWVVWGLGAATSQPPPSALLASGPPDTLAVTELAGRLLPDRAWALHAYLCVAGYAFDTAGRVVLAAPEGLVALWCDVVRAAPGVCATHPARPGLLDHDRLACAAMLWDPHGVGPLSRWPEALVAAEALTGM